MKTKWIDKIAKVKNKTNVELDLSNCATKSKIKKKQQI